MARLSFANSATIEADIVVAADGIPASSFACVFASSHPVFSGSVAYRGLVLRDRVPDWPADRWQMWLGKGRHFLAFPVRAGKLINYVGFVPTDEEMKESWSAPGDPEVLRQAFAGWDPRRIHQLLREVQVTFHGRSTIASRCRSGKTAAQPARRRRIRCFRISDRSLINRSRTAWRWRPFWRKRTRRSADGAIGLRKTAPRARGGSAARRARQRTALRLGLFPIWALGTPRSPRTPNSRKTLYDHDVVPDAQAAATALVQSAAWRR